MKKPRRRSTDKLIAARQGTHGVFRENTTFIQAAKDLARAAPNWSRLSSWQRECLDMEFHKMGRLLFGDPNYVDHWEDQIGYLMRVVEYLREDQT